MSFSLSAWFEQLNTAQKLSIFKFLFLFDFVAIFYSLSSCLLPARPLFLIVLQNGIKKDSHDKGVICDVILEWRIKKETLAQVFSCEFCEIFKNTIFIEHLQTTASGTWFFSLKKIRMPCLHKRRLGLDFSKENVQAAITAI